jgi:hypothetical protein
MKLVRIYLDDQEKAPRFSTDVLGFVNDSNLTVERNQQ